MSQHIPENEPIQSGWQIPALQELTAYFQQDDAVISLALGGSGSQNPENRDRWSDIDLLIVVRNHALPRYFPSMDWLRAFGNIFAYEQHSREYTKTTRVCFFDFRRFDLIFTTETALAQIDTWPQFPWRHRQILFSQEPKIEAALNRTEASFTPELLAYPQFETLVNGFWFKGVVAISKVVRNDLLIALHLSLDLVRDCLVMGMILRDREGGDWNHVVEQMPDTHQPYTAPGILESLRQSGMVFDKLAYQWSPHYQPRSDVFSQWIVYTRQMLKGNDC